MPTPTIDQLIYTARIHGIGYNPPEIEEHRERRGCPTWAEYARIFRIVPVFTRSAAIGTIYIAILPNGAQFDTTDLRDIEREATAHACSAFRMVSL